MISSHKHLLGTTVLAGLLAVTSPAFAQSQEPLNQGTGAQPSQELVPGDADATTLDEIVVTGSRIRRDPTNAPTPLIQVSREALLTTGQSTVIDYLATIPALSNSLVPSDTTGSGLGDGGLSLPNLRSLGSNRTLTLVDGRRHVGSSGGQLSVDIDTIPRLLIQNIEIVTGGASSVYGADAVSGVLNFVLRNDFEGIEFDANYGMINQDGQANKRASLLVGDNLLDDRLNIYGFAEYEDLDEVTSLDIDWLERPRGLFGIDADPTATPFDGDIDTAIFTGFRTLQRPRWGQTTLANNQQASKLSDPDVPYANCSSITSGNCYAVEPGKTWVFEGSGARLANFGQRIGNTGTNRPNTIGGDGDAPAEFATGSRTPSSESARFQVGSTFEITSNISAYAEAKYVTEDTFDIAQPVFFDFIINPYYSSEFIQPVFGFNLFSLNLEDNAFLPNNLRDAIRANTLTRYAPPTADAPSAVTSTVAAPYARHTLFGNDRTQDNSRELQRYVLGLSGQYDQVAFVKNLDWDLSYTYGKVEVENREQGVDVLRFSLAADAVVDTLGEVGSAGSIVCRAQLIAARGEVVDDYFGLGATGELRDSAIGAEAVNECAPLNVFGKGNQSAESLAYIDAAISVLETNEQEQGIASVSGQLWDFWGAGPIGVALGGEYRREYTEAVGRDADTAGRVLFLNTGPDFPGAEYESEEVFAELSVPLFRDLPFLGEYAELSGSYRYADYTTVGNIDVYGVNLVYRPIQDITFKTSFNTSVRVPDLAENFSPFSQTFANGFVDPCATTNINAPGNAEFRDNRIANCTALAAAQGLSFDFAGNTPTNVDDFNPLYTGGVAGVLGGNPFLQPEESDSFTFSTVIQPRFIPNFSLVLDYYEIEIDNVIATVSAQTAANNCVNGPSLNSAACATIFRNNPDIPFGLGAPLGDPIGGFIEGSINYAALTTRGIDFDARYAWDFEEMLGRNWGRLDYSLGGSYLIEQENFLDSTNPANFTSDAGNLFYPRVRLTSSLTYSPNDTYSFNWTVDWQSSNTIIAPRNFVLNADSREFDLIETGDFARHDFTVRWNVRDDLSLRAGVVNAFDAEQAEQLGTTLYSNFDPYGRRFFIGLNFRPGGFGSLWPF